MTNDDYPAVRYTTLTEEVTVDRVDSDERDISRIQTRPYPEEDHSCGWGPFKPEFCQRFRDPRWVLFALCWASATQGMIVNGLVNVVISNLERRFEISSTESGTIASCYDVSSVLFLLPISYFGGHGIKPRYVGIGMFFVGIGSFLFALPHFATDMYTVAGHEENVCHVGGNTTFTCTEGDVTGSLSNYKYVFYVAQLLHGFGSTPLYILGVTYLDENVPMRSSSLYVAIFYTLSVIGPAFGYVAGGQLLKYYTDASSVDTSSLIVSPGNPRWVGAWWVGFLLSGVLAFVVAFPLGGFPRSLPGSSKYESERGQEAHRSSDIGSMLGKDRGLKDLVLSMKSLACNPTFVFLSLSGACEGMVVGGFSAFAPKFIEYQFSLHASVAGQYVGYAVIPAGGGGTFLGGYLVKRFNLKMSGILKLCLGGAIGCCALVTAFFFTCDNVPFAGVNVKYTGSYNASTTMDAYLGDKLESSCNSNCACTQEYYHPVCGQDGVMYFSPCYAGCQESIGGTEFFNCSCINSNWKDDTAYLGKCKSSCAWLPIFMPLFTLLILLSFLTTMPAVSATLRCVPNEQRSFGLGIQSIIIRCLGSIPGPILFGKMIDLNCLLWQQNCDGVGSCFSYDNAKMGHYILTLGLVLKIGSSICFFLALVLYKTPHQGDDSLEDGTHSSNVSTPEDDKDANQKP